MALYYFDIHDGPLSSSDDDGQEFLTLESAEQEAIKILTDLAREFVPKGRAESIRVHVRSGGKPVLQVTLSLDIERL